MVDWLLRWFAPHICEGCGKVGKPLCERCNFNIISQKWSKCVNCKRQMTTTELAKSGNLCSSCGSELPFSGVFVVGERAKTLKKLVGNYKYFSRRESAKVIAELLNSILPEKLPRGLTIVPLPTIPAHIRERGFDHMKLVARELARLQKLPCDLKLLRRTDNISQHSANLRQRQKQARQAFTIDSRRSVSTQILIIDDIYTTGATTAAAARLLKQHGAKDVWLGVVARQNDHRKVKLPVKSRYTLD